MIRSVGILFLGLATTTQAAHIRGSDEVAAVDDVATPPVVTEVDMYGPNGDPSGAALSKMQDTQSLIKKGYGKSAAICAEEEKLTVAWQNEVQDMGQAARKASKEKLAAALENRLAGLRKFLKRLKKMRSRLREHIVRTNTIYETKYTENLDNVHLAANVLKELGMIQTEPWNPHINKIKNFKSFEEQKEDGDAVDATDAPAAVGASGPAEDATPPSNFMQLKETNYMVRPCVLSTTTTQTFGPPNGSFCGLCCFASAAILLTNCSCCFLLFSFSPIFSRPEKPAKRPPALLSMCTNLG